VSREQLLQLVCECVCAEAVLHEDSMEVASLIDAAMQDGSVLAAPPGTLLPLVGRETSASLQLAVTHTIEHESVKVAFCALCVAVPEALIRTSVSALRVESRVGDQQYVLTEQLTPTGCSAYSKCHWQTGGECTAVKKMPRTQRTGRAQPGTLSHRNHRLHCQEAHARNVQHAAHIPAAEQPFSTREVQTPSRNIWPSKKNIF